MSTDSNVERSRGALFLETKKLATWRRVHAIAHEGRSDDEARDLLARSATLALEQHLARTAGEA